MKTWQKIIPPVMVILVCSVAFQLMIKYRRRATPSPVVFTPPAVEVAELKRVDFPPQVSSQGTVEAATALRLVSEVDGRVVTVSPSLKGGGYFDRDELLVAIDPRDYRLAVTRGEAQVASAQLRLATVEAEAAVATKDWEELGRPGEPSALLLRRPQLAEARSALAAAEADLEKAKLDLSRTRIVAPFKGRVRMATAEVGQFVRRGEEVASVFGIERVEVRLPLPLAEMEFLDLPSERTPRAFQENPVQVTLTGRIGRRDHEWFGEVVRVDGEVDRLSRMTSVIVAVDDPYTVGATTGAPPLRVGMFVKATLRGRIAKGVYVLPRTAVRAEAQALAVDREGRLRYRELEILRRDRSQVVVESGFESGDRLCLSTVDIPQDGMPVTIVAEDQGEEQ